jgi:hypothetical protein
LCFCTLAALCKAKGINTASPCTPYQITKSRRLNNLI